MNGADENYQNFKNLNYMQQGGLLNSNNNTIDDKNKHISLTIIGYFRIRILLFKRAPALDFFAEQKALENSSSNFSSPV